jgi:hypothetical protein
MASVSAAAGPVAGSLVKDPVSPADRAALQAVLQWPQDCEQEHQTAVRALELDDARVRFFDLGGHLYLTEVGCTRGAYQDAHRYFLLDESTTPARARTFTLPTYAPDENEHWQPAELDEIAGEATFDAKRKLLTVSTRARGLGDCGTRGVYRVDPKAGKLVLVELFGRTCDGDPDKAPPPDQWPRVFPH